MVTEVKLSWTYGVIRTPPPPLFPWFDTKISIVWPFNSGSATDKTQCTKTQALGVMNNEQETKCCHQDSLNFTLHFPYTTLDYIVLAIMKKCNVQARMELPRMQVSCHFYFSCFLKTVKDSTTEFGTQAEPFSFFTKATFQLKTDESAGPSSSQHLPPLNMQRYCAG